MKILILMLAMILSTSLVFAEEKGEVKKKIIYKQKTTLDFEDDVVEGQASNLDGFYLVHRDQEKFDSLVKKRKNFHKEQMRDVLMIP